MRYAIGYMDTRADEWIFAATETNFENAVVARSNEVPVVVDFWAEWCGPCHALAPVLEGLAAEHGGRFLLAKVDIDRNPQLAAAFGVRSIPMVLGFRAGRVVASFVGAQSEGAIREFLTRILPSPAEQATAAALDLLAAGDSAAAEARLRLALELDVRCDAALLALAQIAHASGRDADALELLDRVAPGSPQRGDADRLAAQIRVGAGGGDIAELEQRLAGDAGNLAARYALAQALAAAGQYEPALTHYLEMVARDRSFDDDAGRKAMLELFDLLGNDHELTQRYRSALAKILFR